MTGNKRRACAALLFTFFPVPAFAQPPKAPPDPALPVSVTAGSWTLLPGGPFVFPDVRLTYADELTLRADRVTGDFRFGDYLATGNVRMHERDTTLTADALRYVGKMGQGTATGAQLVKKPYTLRAKRITGTQNAIVAETADLTTAPPDVSPDISVRASSVSLFPARKRGEMRHATLYLFHSRILTLPRVTFRLGGGGEAQRRQQVRPAFGSSARYGPFMQFRGGLRPLALLPLDYDVLLPARQTPQARIHSGQILYAVAPPSAPAVAAPPEDAFLRSMRALTTVLSSRPLPPGDPLGFRDILPESNPIRLMEELPLAGLFADEDMSAHIAARGRGRDDLYVSRLPEVRLTVRVPLSPVSAPPLPGDPKAFRRDLRRVRVYAEAQASAGQFREEPIHLRQSRARVAASVYARPVLVAPDTVLQPRVSVTSQRYPGRLESYRYMQVAVALNHYFSDLSAASLQFSAADTHGNSPFNFDVLDTSREMDARLQIGDRHLAFAGQLRYDLTRSRVLDYKLAVAPGLRGFTPVFSYNFRTRSIGLGIEIEGLTF